MSDNLMKASGQYFTRINGGAWEACDNRIVDEGIAHILNVALGSKAKPSAYYLALFNGAAAVDANWTAANFPSVAGELVSMTDGYTSATRPQWMPTDTNTNSIDNMTNVATITIATTSQLTITGVALLTSSNKGGTTGTLISAFRYPSPRVLQNGDKMEVGYRASLTV